MNWRDTLMGFGKGATAMLAILGVIALALPLFRSDPPPFVGASRFQELAQNFQQAQQTQEKIAEALRRVTDKQDQQDLDYWTGQQAYAEARLKVTPGDELARGMLKVARDQLEMITARIAASSRPR